MTRGSILALLEKAVGLHQAGAVESAERLYDEVLVLAPGNVNALNLKGVIAADSGRHGDAVTHFARAIASDAFAVEPRLNRGISLAVLGRNDEALTDYTEVLRMMPDQADAYFNKGALLDTLGRGDEAIETFRAMTAQCPTDARGFYNLAIYALRAQDHATAHAMAARACALRPTWPEALIVRAEAAVAAAHFDAAASFAYQALAANDSLAPAHKLLGDLLMRDLRFEAALAHYARAIAVDGHHAETRGNCALLLARMGRHEDAATQYREALRLDPGRPEVRYGYGLALLALGRLQEGWPLYAWRSIGQDRDRDPASRTLAVRRPEVGEALRLEMDQGLGEQIMFAGLFPDLLKTTGDIEVQCEPRLAPLLRRSFPKIRFNPEKRQIVRKSGTLADAARWYRPDFASFPRHAGYVKVDEARREALRARYTTGPNTPLVGLSWMTGNGYKFADQKSIRLHEWESILSKAQARFVSLQYGDVAEEIARANSTRHDHIVLDTSVDASSDLADFAAQVAAMDFVITTSNTTAHVAGALNIPTLVLVPCGFGGLWHWFLDRDDSPWYPSVRLLRQSKRGEWGDVLERAATALDAFTAEYSVRSIKA